MRLDYHCSRERLVPESDEQRLHALQTGIVANINMDGGYGFISPAEAGAADIYFHSSALQGELLFDEQLTGRRVEFEPGINRRTGKPRATAVWPAAD